jgi:hypothetical protein
MNALTMKSKFPIPVFDQLMDELANAKWFSTLDFNSGYHQIRLKSGEEYKTAFQTHFGLFEFNVMAFGLCGAPGTFQGAMNSTLSPLLRKCVLVFFDDILVYSATLSEHLVHLRQVSQLLAADKWQVKLSKCIFAQQQLSYLGHIISAAGIGTDPSKIAVVQSWPQPANIKDLKSFLKTFLHCFVNATPKQWFHWLHLAEFWYNTSCHSALASSPFQVLYGHAPCSFGIEAADAYPVTNLNDWLQERELMQHLVWQHLLRAEDRMKRQANKGRSEREFQVGDKVFLKLQPYVQSSLAPRANQKLKYEFFGPFLILERIGAVAYKLKLPASSSIHPVFHVSQLKVAPPDTIAS